MNARIRLAIPALITTLTVAAGSVSDWTEMNRAAKAAYDAKEYASYRDLLYRLNTITPGHPLLVYNLAGAEALLGNTAAALKGLAACASMGLVSDPASDTDFSALRHNSEFAAIIRRFADNKRAVSHSEAAFTLREADLLAEDIARDSETGCFYVSGLHRRKIVRIGRDGRQSDFMREGQDGAWGIMALAVDSKRRILWATTAALPQSAEYRPEDKGHSAVLQYDLGTGRLTARGDAPPGEGHVLGDMTLDAEGTAIISDASGAVYSVRPGSGNLKAIVPPRTFLSPQTPAAAPDGRIFVPDYGRGIAILDRKTGRIDWLDTAQPTALTGIDGLYLHGRRLIAIQNGTDPQRVVALHLDDSLSRVLRWETVEQNTPELREPTHGVFDGNEFYYIATSGWDQWNGDGTRKPGAAPQPPVILRARVLPR